MAFNIFVSNGSDNGSAPNRRRAIIWTKAGIWSISFKKMHLKCLSVKCRPFCSDHIVSRWRHQMETFSALLALCARNSPVTGESPHKGQWRGALMFSLICANDWVNNGEAGDLRRHRSHYDVTVMVNIYVLRLRVLGSGYITKMRLGVLSFGSLQDLWNQLSLMRVCSWLMKRDWL